MGKFLVTRPDTKRAGRFTSEWLPGHVEADSAADEAEALLTDPRDTIVGVYLWDSRAQQFAGKWLRKEAA